MISDKSIRVGHYADVIASRRVAKDLAGELGFDDTGQEEVSLVVSELATNLIKHAHHGLITLKVSVQEGRRGLLIQSDDDGPGFDFAEALEDGYSTTHTLGSGLGAIRRMVDEMEVSSKHADGRGSYIVCRKWLGGRHPVPAFASHAHLDVGVMTRPKPGQNVNGDQYVVEHFDHCSLLSVIDGLGHGLLAHKAAMAAKQFIESHVDLPLPNLFRGVDLACHATHGVVMAVAVIDWRNEKLSFASIGNIEAKVIHQRKKNDLLVRRGIVGRNAPAPLVSEMDWEKGMGLILHSDGVSSRWHWDEFRRFAQRPSLVLAEQIFRHHNKDSDDATLMIAK